MNTDDNEKDISRFEAGVERWESLQDFAIPIPTREAPRIRRALRPGLIIPGLGPMLGPAREGQNRLQDLVTKLRTEVSGFPMSTVLHGWGTESTKVFLAALHPLLEEDDAVWLVSSDKASQEIEWGIVLDLGRDTDNRLYHNLTGGLVFFPAQEVGEVERARAWEGRARAVVVHDDKEFTSDIEQVVRGTVLYRWPTGVF